MVGRRHVLFGMAFFEGRTVSFKDWFLLSESQTGKEGQGYTQWDPTGYNWVITPYTWPKIYG